MPLYEYWCPHCRRRHTIHVPGFSSPPPPCPGCGREDLERRFSTFSMTRNSQDVYEDILSDTKLKKGLMQNDPQALAEWNRRMSGGEKTAPEYEETVGRLEHGEMPAELTGEGGGDAGEST